MEHEEADPATAEVKIFVVDDHPIVRRALAQLINQERDLVVCGEASNATEALEAIHTVLPDIVVVDLSLGEGPDGIELLKSIRKFRACPVLILSMHDEVRYAERALRAGATGYIMKQEATEVLLAAIRQVLQGELYVSEKVAKRLVQQLIGSEVSPKSAIDELTDRELEIFALIGSGRGTRQIAEGLQLSVKTVETHYAHIKEKLVLKNARELVQRAVEWVTQEGGKPRSNPGGKRSLSA